MKDPKEVVKAFVAAHNRHAMEEMLGYLAEDSTMIDVAAPIPLNNKSDVKKLYEMIFEALPDINFEIVDIIAEGAQVFAAFRTTGTGAGSFGGKDVKGKVIDVFEGMLARVENGKIQSTMFYSDSATLTKQLGGYQTAVSDRF